ncbi:MAG: hypothetical protein Q8L29_00605 [archaeon]|nr:hypothetical protein [archaeon]
MANESLLNPNILLIAKALIIIALSILIGYIGKFLLRKFIDKFILIRVFKKDLSAYEVAKIINKVFTEIIQWMIILLALNYSLVMFNFNLLTNIFSFIISEIPKIVLFLGIISAGLLIAKLITSRIKYKEISNAEEVSFAIEFVVISAFALTALEFIGIKATALIELFKVILYAIAVIIIILVFRPDMLKSKQKKANKK